MSNIEPALGVLDDLPPLSDEARAELLASLEQGRADIAAGCFDALTPGKLRAELEAILADDLDDDALDALLGIAPTSSD